jgi:signal transduction histidine kinase
MTKNPWQGGFPLVRQINEHGLQRWQQGYQLRDLTREWGHLHMCMMEELEDYARGNPNLDKAVMTAARHAWSKLCWDGISDSSTQYWRLNQAEATGRVRDLEQALATLNELDQARAAAWRETAHDLQGSLSLVTLASSVLDREDLSEPARHEFSDLVQRGVSSLHDMLNDFMSLARLDAGLEHLNLSSFDAATLLTDFCTTSQPLARARGLYLKMLGPSSMPVQGDQAKVQRILQNLMLNALKYTERGGVTVLWKPVDDAITDNWMFCIQDTGPGLDDDPESAPPGLFFPGQLLLL